MKYDVLSIQDETSALSIEAGRVNALKNAKIQRYGVRCFENGRVYQTSRLGEASLERLLQDTREWGGPGVDHDYGFASAREERRQGVSISDETLREFEECVRDLVDRHPEFVFSGGCTITRSKVALQSNYGLDLHTSGDACGWYLAYQRKGSGNMFDGVVGEETGSPCVRDVLKDHEEVLKAQAREVSLDGGKLPVLFMEPFEPLAKLTESFLINRYEQGACLFSGKLGMDLFSNRVSIVDQAYDPARGMNRFFDGEGVVRAQDELALIEKGRFQSLLCDLRFAKKFGRMSTGNGLRGYKGGVTLSPHSLRFRGGEKPWREIVCGLDRCLVVMIAAGGDTNDLGEFSTPVQVGYVFEKGELTGRAPQLTLKTSVSRYLKEDLIDISSDGFLKSSPSPCVISEMDVILN